VLQLALVVEERHDRLATIGRREEEREVTEQIQLQIMKAGLFGSK
jgi:hypothetical protein